MRGFPSVRDGTLGTKRDPGYRMGRLVWAGPWVMTGPNPEDGQRRLERGRTAVLEMPSLGRRWF